MASFEHNGATIHYDVYGEGFPLLLFAPGGMRSEASFWPRAEWDPIATLSSSFQVIAMDQRNAGRSTAPISGGDGWHTYTSDHLALLDHLGINQTHLLGGCIGGPYCFGVMEQAPERVAGVVPQQSIGDSGENQGLFYEMFDSWAVGLKAKHPTVSEADWTQFRANMFGGTFAYNVSESFVAGCSIPMLVLMGADPYHPEVTSRRIAEIAPNATLIESWKNPERDNTVATVREFLLMHTPG